MQLKYRNFLIPIYYSVLIKLKNIDSVANLCKKIRNDIKYNNKCKKVNPQY